MSIPWGDVAASPAFKALPPDQQEAARRQYFDDVVAPRAGPYVEQARAQFDAETSLQQFGPGPGVSSPSERAAELRRIDDIRALEGPGMVPSFVGGTTYGVAETGAGTHQMGARLMEFLGHAGELASTRNRGVSPSIDYGLAEGADAIVDNLAAARQADPSMQTAAGQGGRYFGGLVATAPLSYASMPARGAPLMEWLTQGAAGGAAAAATQPVEGGEGFGGRKLEQMGTGAAFGAGIPAALRGAMTVGERLWTPNAMAQVANAANSRANARPFAAEGEDLAKRTGVRMTPGQVSGSKVQTALENMSRQSIFSADRAFEADKRIATDAIRYIDRIMDNVTKNPASEAAVGTQIQATSRGAVERLATQRERVANAQYGAIDKALGNRKFIQPTNAMAEADAIIREYSGVASPEAKRIVAQAQALKEQLREQGGMTFSEAQRSRSYYGRGARGSANVFDDVNRDINRVIATRIFKAFSNDIEQSASRFETNTLGPGIVPQGYFASQAGPDGGRIGEAIKAANANYRKYSQAIDAVKDHPIARLFGDEIKVGDAAQFDKIAPETVIARLGQMQPTELTMVRRYMESNAPEAWQQYKRLLIQRAVDEAKMLPTSYGANTVPFNASMFVRALGGDKAAKVEKLRAVFSAAEMRELDDAFRVARRLGDNFGRNHSGTGPYQEAMRFFDSLKQRSVQGLASTGGEALGLQRIANVMLNAEGRRALIELSRLPPGSRQAASLLGVVAGLAAGQGAVGGNDYGRARHP